VVVEEVIPSLDDGLKKKENRFYIDLLIYVCIKEYQK
jgi:hypothetical protein